MKKNRIRMCKKIITLLLMMIINEVAMGQNTNSAAPDAKMLSGSPSGSGLSSLYSPNLYNGSLNIHIPIYSFINGGTEYGISLGYNTMGVKVDETSSEIATHWNLEAEPGIVRVIRDVPDECYYITDSILREDPLIVNQERYIKGKLLTYTETAQQQAAPNVYRDGECDEFIFSGSNGKKISFYIGKDFKVFTHPHSNIRIEALLNTTGPSPVLNFIITDENGIRYEFVSGDKEYLSLQGFSDWQWAGLDYEGVYATSRWVPESITLADGRKIRYTHSAPFTGYHGHLFVEYKSYLAREFSGNFFVGVSNKIYNTYTQLSSISYPNGTTATFIFHPDDQSEKGAKMADEIRISAGNNCMRYRLYRDSINHRWFLNRITLLSCDSSIEEPYYKFTYNTTQLPTRLNSAQDFFGYYNGDPLGTALGSSGDSITIPVHGTGYGNERISNPSYTAAGLLNSVRNAFGGELDFFYGMNTATGQLSGLPTDNKFVGTAAMDGVRIDSVKEWDRYRPGNIHTTTYTYSGGQFFITGGYFHYPNYIDSATGQVESNMFQSLFLTAHQLVNGANHGYSGVSVKSLADGALLSRTDYTFTNMKDATSNNQPRYYKVPGSKDFYQYPYTDKQYLKDWEMGLPITVTDYDQNNRIVTQTINEYNFSPVDLSSAAYIENTKVAKVNSGTQQEAYGSTWVDVYYPYQKTFSDSYYPFTGTANLQKTITLKYVSDTRYVSDTVEYVYDSRNNLKRTITQDSKGDRLASILVYNYDVDGPDMPSGYTEHPGTTLYDMTRDSLEKVVSVERWELATETPFLLQNAYVTGFHYSDGKLWTKNVVASDFSAPLSYTDYTGFPFGSSGNPYGKVLSTYNSTTSIDAMARTSDVALFDLEGNPRETKYVDKNVYKAMIWDTATGRKLAEAANCRYTDIAYTSFESSLYGSNLSLSSTWYVPPGISGSNAASLWTPQSPGTAISVNGTQNLQAGKEYILSFWIKGAAPSAFIGTTAIPLGTPAYTNGTWKQYILRFTPAAAAKIRITGSGPLSYIDELRLFPARAQMRSWTYAPLFGVSSATDASGRITYYEYDKLGRQSLIRNQEGNIVSKTIHHVGE